MSRSKITAVLKYERGFTLPELLITIAIMGILAAIAVPSWQTVIEGRQVDSATNQLVSNLRLAHSKTTNRLTPYRVVFADGVSSYQVGPVGSLKTYDLCGDDGCDSNDPKVNTSLTVLEFKPDGSVTGPAETANEIEVSKTSPATAPKRGISINPATARIKVD